MNRLLGAREDVENRGETMWSAWEQKYFGLQTVLGLGFVDFTVGHLKSEMLQNYKLFECHVNAQKSVD